MEVRALIFDLGQVIVKFDPIAMRQVFIKDNPDREHLPLSHWPEAIEYECGRLSTAEFAAHVGQLIGRPLTEAEFDACWGPVFELNPPVAQLIPALSQQYPLILLSNTNESHWRWIRTSFPDVFRHFTACLVSFELGNMKPAPEVFLRAAAATGHAPEHCLFIDDIAAYVEAARASGLQAMQYVGAATDDWLQSLLFRE